MKPAIKIENLSKQSRLGLVGTGTLSHDLKRWWHLVRGKVEKTICDLRFVTSDLASLVNQIAQIKPITILLSTFVNPQSYIADLQVTILLTDRFQWLIEP